MSDKNKKLETLLGKVLHEFAYELDMNYDNDMMGIIANEDSTFLIFRRAAWVLRKRRVKLTSRVLHVERRIEAAYRDAFNEPLPAPGGRKGSDKVF